MYVPRSEALTCIDIDTASTRFACTARTARTKFLISMKGRFDLHKMSCLVFCRRANKNTSKLSRRNAAPGRRAAADAKFRAPDLGLASPWYPDEIPIAKADHLLADTGEALNGTGEREKRTDNNGQPSPDCHATSFASLPRRQSCFDK
jgi:hypothetical protein